MSLLKKSPTNFRNINLGNKPHNSDQTGVMVRPPGFSGVKTLFLGITYGNTVNIDYLSHL